MKPDSRLLSSTVGFVALFALAAGAGSGLLAQKRSQAVVTPDNPIWAGDLQDPPPQPQEPPQDPANPPAAGDAAAAGQGRGGRGNQPRPYNQVITKEATTDDGIFKVHRIREQVFYEIPKAQLGKDFLWVTQIKRTATGAGLGGDPVGSRVVRWELSGQSKLPSRSSRIARAGWR